LIGHWVPHVRAWGSPTTAYFQKHIKYAIVRLRGCARVTDRRSLSRGTGLLDSVNASSSGSSGVHTDAAGSRTRALAPACDQR
jgi:hypothetical protein